ncbi:MAG: Uma2 family endonuclease [Anaerolineae bacterium]
MALREQEAVLTPLTVPEEVDDEFYYGHRIVITHDEAGREIFTYQPLTLEDFLDPQEGDHFVQGTLHNDDTEQAKSIFRHLHEEDSTAAVFSDLKMVWDIEGLSQPAPDVAVIPNVKDPDRPRREFDVAVEGTRPRFVLEIVSPRYRKPDREEKVAIYERAGVEEYVIIDSWLQEGEVSYEVLGYRLEEGVYVEIEPDERGWIYSAVNNVWIGVSEERDRFFVVDARTGERILPDREARLIAEGRAQFEAAARVEAERRAQALEAEIARLREQMERNRPA